MKINILQWRYSPFFMLLGFSLLGINTANAAINCTSTMSDISFGNVYPQSTQTDSTATLNYKCTNDESRTASAKVCFSIGSPGGTSRQMQNGAANKLNYEFFQDPSRSIVWGSQFFGSKTPLVEDITIPENGVFSDTAIIYGRVTGNQVFVIPGTYTSSYGKGDTAVTVNGQRGNAAPRSCATKTQADQFDFRVQARVIDECKITTIGALDFGSIISSSTPTTVSSGANLINVTCSRDVPYNIGLASVNNPGNKTGAGIMKSTSTGDTVPYQLHSDANVENVWGNTATSTNLGNGVGRTGTGVVQGETVYATAPSTDVKPGSYSDTVTVHVNY